MSRYFFFVPIVFFFGVSSLAGATPERKYPRVNDVLPSFSVSAGSSPSTIDISKFKGSVLLLNFWATWCPPCIEEMPSMDELNRRFKAKPFTLLAVSVDDSWSAVEEFLKHLNRPPTFMLAHDVQKSVAFGIFGVVQYPESFLIDKKGIIRAYYPGPVNWTSPEVLRQLTEIVNEK